MLAKAVDKVLGRIARGLGAGEEEGQTFVNHAHISILEVLITDTNRQKVSLLGKLWVLSNLRLALNDDFLDKGAQGDCIALRVSLPLSDEYPGKGWEQLDVS